MFKVDRIGTFEDLKSPRIRYSQDPECVGSGFHFHLGYTELFLGSISTSVWTKYLSHPVRMDKTFPAFNFLSVLLVSNIFRTSIFTQHQRSEAADEILCKQPAAEHRTKCFLFALRVWDTLRHFMWNSIVNVEFLVKGLTFLTQDNCHQRNLHWTEQLWQWRA